MQLAKRMTVLCLFACVTCSARQVANPTGMRDHEQGQVSLHLERSETPAARGHGTIVVVVAAKNGYALAADSRLTLSNSSGEVVGRRDDGQKSFPVGKITACVVAGNVSSTAPGDGFVLEASVAREMESQNQVLRRNSRLAEYMDAREFASLFQDRLFTVILGLLDAQVTHLQNPVFGMSAVSFRPDGTRQWVSYYQDFTVEADFAGRKYFSPGKITPIPEPASQVVAIGAASSMVYGVTSLDRPTDAIPFTTTHIMRRYFELKKGGHLEELSLLEAQRLAAGLVEDAVRRAPEEDGVGGPIDLATLSADGFRWIAQKQNVAPLTPMFKSRYTNYFADSNGPQPLDGFECVRCTFRNQTFTFKGNADFRLVQPIFRDECEVKLDANAKYRKPQAVDQIRRVMGSSCKVTELPAQRYGR
jgi:hypothetical protein